jgi:hypothetical protein
LAQQAGAQESDIEGLADPARVNARQLSDWLLDAGNSSALGVLNQLQEEDRKIVGALERILRDSAVGGNGLAIVKSDHVAHRSLCQDFAIAIDPSKVISSFGTPGKFLYGGDNFTSEGNDYQYMTAAAEIHGDRALLAAVVHKGTENRESLPSMVKLNQFQLFLSQYLAVRLLAEN